PITDDDVDRIATCLRVFSDQSPLMTEIFNAASRNSVSLMLAAKMAEEKQAQQVLACEAVAGLLPWRNNLTVVKVQADDSISFAQLINKNEMGATENMFELTLSQALGMTYKKEKDPLGSTKLNKVTQLTGFSDPVYAKAYVNVNQFDIVLDVLVVNQTSDTLQNLTVELATLGNQTSDTLQNLTVELATLGNQTSDTLQNLTVELATLGNQTSDTLQNLTVELATLGNQTSDTLQNLTVELATLGNQTSDTLQNLTVELATLGNQTSDTLQNLTVELATLGNLKLVEKPMPLMMAPHDFCNIKANVKVASTENGIIFGNIVYDVTGAASDRNVVVLNDIHIDIMEYMCQQPATTLSSEFEWENKVAVNTHSRPEGVPCPCHQVHQHEMPNSRE
ncbi:COPB-like protein, partial [Mya arenaria]